MVVIKEKEERKRGETSMKFLEAVRIENEGKLLGNDYYPDYVYKIENGLLLYKNKEDEDEPTVVVIDEYEQTANWHIVEPEKPKQKWFKHEYFIKLSDGCFSIDRTITVYVWDNFKNPSRTLLSTQELETDETDIAKIWRLFEEGK